MKLSDEERKELADQIKRLIKDAWDYSLTQDQPEEPNYELVLQLLHDLGSEVEEQLPATVQRKVWNYRYAKYHLFLRYNVIDKVVEVHPTHLVGVIPGEDVYINQLRHKFDTDQTQAIELDGVKAPASLIFLPPFHTLPELLQEQIFWFHERSGYANYAKFLNLGQPAINLKFHIKHKYAFKKDLPHQEIEEMLKIKIKDLTSGHLDQETGKILIKNETLNHRAYIQKYTDILNNIEKYEFSKSNYHNQYHYLTLDYRYIKPNPQHPDFDSDQVQVSRKRVANFIFVDQDLLERKVPNKHKTVHKYLKESHPLFITKRMTFYYKPKE